MIQALASTGRQTRIGFANPLLYGLKSSVYHDVVPQRTPVAVGALSVTGYQGFGLSVHPAFVPDIEAFQDALSAVYDDLWAAAREQAPDLARTSTP